MNASPTVAYGFTEGCFTEGCLWLYRRLPMALHSASCGYWRQSEPAST